MERTANFNVSFSSAASTSSDTSEFTPVFRQTALGGGSNIDDDHALPTSTWSGYKINAELNEKANSTALADAYTAGTAYAVGDYCSYLGDMYVCATTIASAPSTFDATQWTMITVAEYIDPATAAEVSAVISGYEAT